MRNIIMNDKLIEYSYNLPQLDLDMMISLNSHLLHFE